MRRFDDGRAGADMLRVFVCGRTADGMADVRILLKVSGKVTTN